MAAPDKPTDSTIHGRRKRDAELVRQRSSHWVTLPGDLWLKPHSPLALCDLLASARARLQLVADDPAHTGAPGASAERAPVRLPVSDAQQPRRCANLLTRHHPAELVERCQQILVDNALVKQWHARRLYLIAGFVRESRPESAEAAQWPLLFYPVVLLREPVPDAAPETWHYALELDGNPPDINPHLRRHLQTRYGLALPALERSTDVADFLTSLTGLLCQVPQLELGFEMAAGSCVPPLHDAPAGNLEALMPALPAHFDMDLARRVARQNSLPELHAVVSMLRHYADRPLLHDSGEPVETPAPAAPSNLRLHAEQLVARGLAQFDCQQLRSLPEHLDRWADQVVQALQGEVIGEQLFGQTVSVRHLVRLGGVIELIDKAPLTIDRYAFADLCYASSPGLFRRARHQARLIEEEFNALREVFVLERIPSRKQLLALIDELAHAVGSGPDVVGSTYFNARRQFMEFSVEKPATLTNDHRRAIAQLEKLLRFRELFVNNTEYRLALGPGYRGLRTDWAELDTMLDYARELAEVLESETLAGCLLSQWEAFRQAHIRELPALQAAAEALRRLLAIEGLHFQHEPAEPLVARARQSAGLLRQWQQQYGELPDHDELTPALVLGQFQSAASRTVGDELDLQAWFGQREHSREALIDTLDWLQQAGDTASELQLDVGAIAECLRIA